MSSPSLTLLKLEGCRVTLWTSSRRAASRPWLPAKRFRRFGRARRGGVAARAACRRAHARTSGLRGPGVCAHCSTGQSAAVACDTQAKRARCLSTSARGEAHFSAALNRHATSCPQPPPAASNDISCQPITLTAALSARCQLRRCGRRSAGRSVQGVCCQRTCQWRWALRARCGRLRRRRARAGAA